MGWTGNPAAELRSHSGCACSDASAYSYASRVWLQTNAGINKSAAGNHVNRRPVARDLRKRHNHKEILAAVRLIAQSDYDLLATWINDDPAHRGVLGPEFWFDRRRVSFVIEDKEGPVMFVNFVAQPPAMRLYIQFCSDALRVAKAMYKTFAAVKKMIQKTGAQQIVFDTQNPKLANFCSRAFGFERIMDSNDYQVSV